MLSINLEISLISINLEIDEVKAIRGVLAHYCIGTCGEMHKGCDMRSMMMLYV